MTQQEAWKMVEEMEQHNQCDITAQHKKPPLAGEANLEAIWHVQAC